MQRLTKFAKEHNVAVIEDACQAHGSMWENKYLGTWGDFGCFSMRDGKLISTGEGGFILTNNSELAEKCRFLRNHWTNPANPEHSFAQLAWNYRLTEVQALFGSAQLKYFQEILAERKLQSQYLFDCLLSVPDIGQYKYYEEETSNYFSPVFFIKGNKNGKRISSELARLGVINSVGSFGLRPVYERSVFSKVVSERGKSELDKDYNSIYSLNASNFFEKVLSLVLLPSYSKNHLDEMANKIKYVLGS